MLARRSHQLGRSRLAARPPGAAHASAAALSRRPAPVDAALAAAAVLAVVAVAALVTAAACAGAVRDALDFGFGGVPRTLGEAGAVFLHNARLMGAVAAGVLVVQAPRFERADGSLGRGGTFLRTVADIVLALAVAVNAAVVGAALGAYGERMWRAVLPHAPLELAAYACALALYLRARDARLAPRPALTLAASALALLALAALVEVFAQL